MDNKELRRNLDTIFEKEYYNPQKTIVSRRYIHKPKSPRATGRRSYISRSDELPLLIENPEEYELEFPNLKLLMVLYNSISHDKENTKYFINYMISRFDVQSRPAITSYLAFETLFRLGFVKEAFYSWGKYFVERIKRRESSSELFRRFGFTIDYTLWNLSNIIRYEYNSINEADLDLINSNIQGIRKFLKKTHFYKERKISETIIRQINEIRYSKLKVVLLEVKYTFLFYYSTM